MLIDVEDWGCDLKTLGAYVKLVLKSNNGQLVSSVAEISDLFGLSTRQTRTVLDRLIASKKIKTIATNKNTTYVIENNKKNRTRKRKATNGATSKTTNENTTQSIEIINENKSQKLKATSKTTNENTLENNDNNINNVTVKWILETWTKAYKYYTQSEPVILWGKDGACAKRLKFKDKHHARSLIKHFFEKNDPEKWNFAFFAACFNSLNASLGYNPLSLGGANGRTVKD